MQYLNPSFTVSASTPSTDEDRWAQAFGYDDYESYEKVRKFKLAKAIYEQSCKKKEPLPRKCGGGIGSGKVQS